MQKYHILINISWIFLHNQKLVFIKDTYTNQQVLHKYHNINIITQLSFLIFLFNQKTSVHQGYFAEKVNCAKIS